MPNETLSNSPLLKGIRREDLEHLIDAGEIKWIASGEVLIREGEYNERLYILLQGTLEVCLPHTADRFTKVVIGTLGPGSVVGEYSFIDKNPASAAVIARDPVEVYTIRNCDFTAVLERHSDLGRTIFRNLLTILIRRLRDSNTMFDMIKPAKERKASSERYG